MGEESNKEHWERVYASKSVERLGWYEPYLQLSLDWIRKLALPADAPIIDVGGGASTLVDDLLDAGHRNITVIDISSPALELARARLGARADQVTWRVGDITTLDLPSHHFALWHDRAVFHFLTETSTQLRYREKLFHALRPGGQVIMGTFDLKAPPTCSGLPVQRYDVERLQQILGEELVLQRWHKTMHVTPGGVEQMYLYCLFRKTG